MKVHDMRVRKDTPKDGKKGQDVGMNDMNEILCRPLRRYAVILSSHKLYGPPITLLFGDTAMAPD